jgi:hypothetical protein
MEKTSVPYFGFDVVSKHQVSNNPNKGVYGRRKTLTLGPSQVKELKAAQQSTYE